MQAGKFLNWALEDLMDRGQEALDMMIKNLNLFCFKDDMFLEFQSSASEVVHANHLCCENYT